MAMMMLLFLICCLLISSSAKPQSDRHAYTVNYKFNPLGLLGYHYSFGTSNGITRQETGEVKNEGQPDESLLVRGRYSYVLDGITYMVRYVADKFGFRPEGDHLPPAADITSPQPPPKPTPFTPISCVYLASCSG